MSSPSSDRAAPPPPRVGTSGWAYPAWVGPLYPARTPAGRMLGHYATRFSTVEAHSTHRRQPSAAALEKWAAQTPATFRFAPKAHANLTHQRDLTGLDERMAAFTGALAPLGARLGPLLLVLPHRQPDLDRLDGLLAALPPSPPGPPAVFELAPAWHVPAVVDRLVEAGASLALVDRDGDPGPEPDPPPGPLAYVRLRAPGYTEAQLDAWSARLLAWSRSGRPTYAFVRHDETGDAPRYAGRLVERLGDP